MNDALNEKNGQILKLTGELGQIAVREKEIEALSAELENLKELVLAKNKENEKLKK